MSSKSKGSVVLAMALFLGSAPSWAASVEGRPAFGDSSPASAFSDVVVGALSHWFGSVWQAGRDTASSIWAEYGIAIDPDGVPVDPSHASSVANPTDPATH